MKMNVTPEEFSWIHKLNDDCRRSTIHFDDNRWLKKITEKFGPRPLGWEDKLVDVVVRYDALNVPCEGIPRFEEK